MGRACSNELLVHNPQGRIELCSCGTLHVHFGNLSLRLNGDELRQLDALVHEATRVLDGERRRRSGLSLVRSDPGSSSAH